MCVMTNIWTLYRKYMIVINIQLCRSLNVCCGQLWVWHMFSGQDLWWTMSLHIFHWSCWDTIWIPNDHMDLCQTHCVQVPDFSCPLGSRGPRFKSIANKDWLLPVPTYRSTWVVLWLLFFNAYFIHILKKKDCALVHDSQLGAILKNYLVRWLIVICIGTCHSTTPVTWSAPDQVISSTDIAN